MHMPLYFLLSFAHFKICHLKICHWKVCHFNTLAHQSKPCYVLPRRGICQFFLYATRYIFYTQSTSSIFEGTRPCKRFCLVIDSCRSVSSAHLISLLCIETICCLCNSKKLTRVNRCFLCFSAVSLKLFISGS